MSACDLNDFQASASELNDPWFPGIIHVHTEKSLGLEFQHFLA